MRISALKLRRTVNGVEKILKGMIPAKRDRYASIRGRDDKGHYIYGELHEAAQVGDDAKKATLRSYEELNDVLFSLRNTIGVFNNEKGVSPILNEIAHVKMLRNAVDATASKCEKPPFESSNSSFAEGNSEAYIEKLKLDVRSYDRKIQDLTDKCTAINAGHELDISDEHFELLKSHGLLD